MNLHKIRNESLLSVMEVFKTFRDARMSKASGALPLMEQWGAEERWVFSFANYFISVNKMWATIEETAYCFIPPAPVAEVTFIDFIRMIRHYQNEKYSAANEKELILFLRKCTEELREFFMMLLSRPQWAMLLFRNKELQEYSDMTSINSGDIYSPPSILTDGFYSISFPFTVTAVPKSELVPAVIVCTAMGIKVLKKINVHSQNRSFELVRVPNDCIKMDLQFLAHRTFTLYGLLDEEGEKFYPLDMFKNYKEYVSVSKKRQATPYEERCANLSRLLATVFLIHIQKVPRTICRHPSEVADCCEGTLSDDNPVLLLADRFHREHVAESVQREGVIGGLWEEHGEVKGLIVWYNAVAYHCPHRFSGVSSSLLHKPSVLKGKPVVFRIIEFDKFVFGSISQILWSKKPYRATPYTFEDGTVGYIERCPYCLRQDVAQHCDGMCDNTWTGWRALFAKWGADTWFKVTPKILKRREQYGWYPSSINQVEAYHKHYRIRANEQGEIMFETDHTKKEKIR